MVESRPQPWNAVITDLGFIPTVLVVFRLSKDNGATPQQDDMIRLVSGLLDRVPGDACCTWTTSTSGCCAAAAT